MADIKNVYTKTGDMTAANIIDIIKQPAALFPDKACFRYRRGDAEYQATFVEFLGLVEAFTAALNGLGLSGKHIAILSEKSVEWISAYFAIINAGGVAVPLDYDIKREQLAGFMDFADCEGIIYSEKYVTAVEESRGNMPDVKSYIKIENALLPDAGMPSAAIDKTGGMFTYRDIVAFGYELIASGSAAAVAADPDKMCALIFTSGTTGTSKGVMLSQRNITFDINQSAKLVDLSTEDVLVSVLPIFHTYEMTAGILLPMLYGATICINDSIANALRDFKHYKPTMLALVPLFVSTIYKRIMDTAAKKGSAKSLAVAIQISKYARFIGLDLRKRLFDEIQSALGGRLRTIVCGGAAMNPELVMWFDAVGIQLKQGYGITECSPIISVVPYDVVRPASCGKPIEGSQVFIDREDPSDEAGEIVFKGDNVMLGYYKNPQATEEVKTRRGWFYTGDCGYMDKDGYLYITGRRKNVIVLNSGKNVFPEEIEEYLENIPFIRECMVLGRVSGDNTIKLTAVIYPDYEKASENNLLSDEAIQAYFKEQIIALNKTLVVYKQIRNVEIRKTPFLKTTTQKIQRHRVDEE
ncbi:MAG: AMP-binding protein [Eubacteriales bacterium]|jgi:long-chain acyl-CoA synthetase|nr:AMP-binding protein [Eubacteriales bacterium]